MQYFPLMLQNKIADMALRLESARLLTYQAASLKDEGKKYTKVWCYVLSINLNFSSRQCILISYNIFVNFSVY